MNDDFSFLVKRVLVSNPETIYFHLIADPQYVEVPVGTDLKRDKVFLQFEQRIWKYDIIEDKDWSSSRKWTLR